MDTIRVLLYVLFSSFFTSSNHSPLPSSSTNNVGETCRKRIWLICWADAIPTRSTSANHRKAKERPWMPHGLVSSTRTIPPTPTCRQAADLNCYPSTLDHPCKHFTPPSPVRRPLANHTRTHQSRSALLLLCRRGRMRMLRRLLRMCRGLLLEHIPIHVSRSSAPCPRTERLKKTKDKGGIKQKPQLDEIVQ